jgi:hypothetical protein
MQNNRKAPLTRRIDLSHCELLSTYGRNLANGPKGLAVKIGSIIKPKKGSETR